MAGPNLEVFKFGMYIMFPIGIMYYFGVNLDEKFSTPDFWPKKNQTHTIPFEKEEISKELAILKQQRLAARQRRLAYEATNDAREGRAGDGLSSVDANELDMVKAMEANTTQINSTAPQKSSRSWLSWLK